VHKKCPRSEAADDTVCLIFAAAGSAEKLTELAHHNKQILLHKITSVRNWLEQKTLLKY
jgi:hypothetical protein